MISLIPCPTAIIESSDNVTVYINRSTGEVTIDDGYMVESFDAAGFMAHVTIKRHAA